jgi:hypothetical protein
MPNVVRVSPPQQVIFRQSTPPKKKTWKRILMKRKGIITNLNKVSCCKISKMQRALSLRAQMRILIQ